jgi:hypothetical protein
VHSTNEPSVGCRVYGVRCRVYGVGCMVTVRSAAPSPISRRLVVFLPQTGEAKVGDLNTALAACCLVQNILWFDV